MTKALKHDSEKPPLALLPSAALFEVGRALQHGARKYSPENWREGFEQLRLVSAAMRHIFQWKDEDHKDSESGLSHLAHACCMILFALEQELTGTGVDDSWVALRAALDKDLLQEDDEYTQDIAPITI